MRITTFLFTLLIAAYFIQGFNAPKCDHVFTQVEQPTVKIEQPQLSGSAIYAIGTWPTGKKEGAELICVKCFHKQKQIIDYGEPVKPSLTWPDGTKCCDSIKTFNGGTGIIKGGNLQYDTAGIFRISTHAY